MKFAKLQGAGNDFILVDARDTKQDWAKLAQTMCLRHFGIGADGLILVQNSDVADLKMRMFNPDGSEAEACGNGLRCFAKYTIDKGIYQPPCHSERSEESTDKIPALMVSIETLSGIRKAKAYLSEDKVSHVQVSMGMPQFQPEQIPITPSQALSYKKQKSQYIPESGEAEIKQCQPILDYPLMSGGRKLILSLLSMGNPHAVNFLSEPVASFPLSEVGPEVGKHPLFPRRTNFEIARVLSRGKIEARVWERGAGETLACGSGACAIAVAAQLLGRIDSRVDIMLPGGTLTVYWDRVGEVLLTGPAEEVFTGEYLI